MIKGLVSILAPCYNGETYILRFLESILSQDYSNIELIIIDDGSSDNTKSIILNQKNKFFKKNMNLIYLFQEHKGQAEAINTGLQYVHGEYLTWLDSDDYISQDCIKEKVEFLKANPEYGFVTSSMAVVTEENPFKIIKELCWSNLNRKNYFEDLLAENNVTFAGHLTRTDNFIKVNPEMYIFPSKEGQNWQLLLPLAYKYKCGYISKNLYFYVKRKNSHSHQKRNQIETITRFENFEILLKETLKKIPLSEQESFFYTSFIEEKYKIKKMKVAYKYHEKELFKKFYDSISNKQVLGFKFKLKRFIWDFIK